MALTIRPITDLAIGADKSPSHCEPITLLGLNVIDEATFRPRVPTAAPNFTYQPSQGGRMGVFAVTTADSVTRAWILLLPEKGSPDRVMIAFPPRIGQAGDYYTNLGASDPLSLPLIRDYMALIAGIDPYSGDMRNGTVQACYGSQVLGGGRSMAFLFPVRALRKGGHTDEELGPFSDDAAVLADTINGIATATQGSFSPANVETFTHSNGIAFFNPFLRALNSKFSVRLAIALDPVNAQTIDTKATAAVMQHLSGQTGGIVNGKPTGNFEYWPFERWKNEPDRDAKMKGWHNNYFTYLHNYAFPRYLLRLSIRVTSP